MGLYETVRDYFSGRKVRDMTTIVQEQVRLQQSHENILATRNEHGIQSVQFDSYSPMVSAAMGGAVLGGVFGPIGSIAGATLGGYCGYRAGMNMISK